MDGKGMECERVTKCEDRWHDEIFSVRRLRTPEWGELQPFFGGVLVFKVLAVVLVGWTV